MRRKLQRIGGKSWGVIVSRDMLDALGFTVQERESGDLTVLIEEADGALVVRRAGHTTPVSKRIAEPPVGAPPVKEWQQRLLQAVRDHGPATTVEIAAVVGRTREQTSTNLNKLKRAGLVERELGAGGWVLRAGSSSS